MFVISIVKPFVLEYDTENFNVISMRGQDLAMHYVLLAVV